MKSRDFTSVSKNVKTAQFRMDLWIIHASEQFHDTSRPLPWA